MNPMEVEQFEEELRALQEQLHERDAMLVQLLEPLVDRPGRLGKGEPWVLLERDDPEALVEEAVEQIGHLKRDEATLAEQNGTLNDAGLLTEHDELDRRRLEQYDPDVVDFFTALDRALTSETGDPVTTFKIHLERSGILPHATTYQPEQLADAFANILLL